MTVGVSELVADPGASKLLTAAFTCRWRTQTSDVRGIPCKDSQLDIYSAFCTPLTLSSESPGGREGDDGSSRPRGFFGLGGRASEVEVTGGGVATVGATESDEQRCRNIQFTSIHSFLQGTKCSSPFAVVSLASPSPPGCWPPTPDSMQGGGGLSTIVRGATGSPEPQISWGTWKEKRNENPELRES